MTTKKHAPGEIDAVEYLKSQHREVEDLFAKLEKTTENAVKTRIQLFGELALKIEGHAQIEEQNFYPEGTAADRDMTLEAYEEHAMVRHMIGQIKDLEFSDATFKAKVTVLKEMIEHHVKEEEQEYFPKVRKALGDDALAELGAAMQEQFEEFLLDPKTGPKTAKAAEAKAVRSAYSESATH